jgi:hypothetical protein
VSGPRSYPAPTGRDIDFKALATISDEEADAGEDVGLQGNQHYRDMRGVTWNQVADALDREAALFQRFAASADVDEEAERYEEEREEAFMPEEDLWGLDIGVVGATLALSALGATTVSSCNAGGFGGFHVAQFPHVVFFLPKELTAEVLAIAAAADVGLSMTIGGLVCLSGRTDLDLHRFGEAALARQHAREAGALAE